MMWRAPFELVMASASPALVDMVRTRRERGERPKRTATVLARGDRLYAVVDFHGPGRPGVRGTLDVWLWENLR